MGSLAGQQNTVSSPPVTGPGGGRKPRFLCLHGFRTSGDIMRTQVLGKWPGPVTARLDLVFADAPFPAEGRSDVDGIFPPPYYEWYQFDKAEYRNFEECLEYIEDLIVKYGPFDGVMGFSQGAILSSVLPGLQEKGLALTKVPKLKYVVIIGGAKSRSSAIAENAYSPKIKCPSLHFLGDMDFLRTQGEALLEAFIDPIVIRHPKGHTVPRLDDKSLEIMLSYLERIEKDLQKDAVLDEEHKEEYIC
ncbi:esterase-like [Iris pallida]|uniref:Esterase-like n=1 Tax=Iris pallida TaxID=29817 RepID=A0AAX6F608_IRIPA|nr:esterase-like [Iris pallida]